VSVVATVSATTVVSTCVPRVSDAHSVRFEQQQDAKQSIAATIIPIFVMLNFAFYVLFFLYMF
jgi:hypothetical protein